MFDQSWLSNLLELQKKASELTQNQNSTDEIQSMIKSVLSQWGISSFPWEENFQSFGGFQNNKPNEAKNDSHFNIDISGKKDFVQIQILLPGITQPNDLQIKLSGNTLNINAKINCINENENSFNRKIQLPYEVTPTGASAVYKDNYLLITIPKIPLEGENIPFDFYSPS